jgi:endonuclease III
MSDKIINERIVKDMLRYRPCPQMTNVVKATNLDSWGLSREVGEFLLQNPNAVLFGAIFNYFIRYEKALAAPLELHRRLGHIDPFRLAKMQEGQLLPYVQRGQHGQALHRFPAALARRIISASNKLVSEYKGSASNIWPNNVRASVVMKRLEGFEGISQKISRMMGRWLGTYFGITLTNWDEIDVAVDRHVARVFLRTGLVDRQKGIYSVSEVRDDIIRRARYLRPSFPGCVDEPAFNIGFRWCTSEEAYCDRAGEPCPIGNACRKKRFANTK